MMVSEKYTVILKIAGYFFIPFVFGYLFFSKASNEENKVLVNSLTPVHSYNLVKHDGNTLNDNKFIGRWSFVFFGFTNCPDVCPATLSQMAVLNKKLSKQDVIADLAQFMFVSVDPARDSLEHLSQYVTYFNPEFIGVTGDSKDIVSFEKQFGAFHQYGKKDSHGGYSVAHTSSVFLINPKGKITMEMTPPLNLETVLKQVSTLVNEFNTTLS